MIILLNLLVPSPIKEIVVEFKTSKKCYLQSIIAVRRRIKILELLASSKPLTTKQITTALDEKAARIIEDMQRLKHNGYVVADHKGNCPLGNKQSFFYKKTKKKYYGYEFIASIEVNDDLEASLREYRVNFKANINNDKPGKDIYIKVEGNPHATIVMNSNRPAGFYSYQKPKPQVNRGIGSTFALYDGAL